MVTRARHLHVWLGSSVRSQTIPNSLSSSYLPQQIAQPVKEGFPSTELPEIGEIGLEHEVEGRSPFSVRTMAALGVGFGPAGAASPNGILS